MSNTAGSGTLGIEVPDGVPDAIEAGASALRGISGVLERTGAAFAGGRPAGWTGSAAIGFGDRCTDEGVAATRAGEAMELGARVLHDLAGDLRAAQRAARHEIAAARDAKARADRAREAAEQARTEATAARQSAAASAKRAALTEVVGATPAVGDRAAERSALARAGEADIARARHERSAAAADDDLATAQRRGRDLIQRYEETARQAGQMLAGLAAQAPVVSAVNGQPVAATGGPGRPPAVAPVTVSASPAPRAADESDDDGGGLLGSIVHGGLDAVGLVPLLGEPADAVNGLIYTVEGNEVDAALSFAAVVPGVGMGATAAKYGRKGVNALEESSDAARSSVRRNWDETPSEGFHYTRTQILDKIEENGLFGGSYVTKDSTLSPLQAQVDLALPPNRGLPGAVIRVDLEGMRRAGFDVGDFSQVGRRYSMPGGGTELQIEQPIPPEFLKVIRR